MTLTAICTEKNTEYVKIVISENFLEKHQMQKALENDFTEIISILTDSEIEEIKDEESPDDITGIINFMGLLPTITI